MPIKNINNELNSINNISNNFLNLNKKSKFLNNFNKNENLNEFPNIKEHSSYNFMSFNKDITNYNTKTTELNSNSNNDNNTQIKNNYIFNSKFYSYEIRFGCSIQNLYNNKSMVIFNSLNSFSNNNILNLEDYLHYLKIIFHCINTPLDNIQNNLWRTENLSSNLIR